MLGWRRAAGAWRAAGAAQHPWPASLALAAHRRRLEMVRQASLVVCFVNARPTGGTRPSWRELAGLL